MKEKVKLTSFEGSIFDMLRVLSRNSTCTRRQNAAILVSEDGNIISTGYNGPPRGMLHCGENGCLRGQIGLDYIPSGARLDMCSAMHAEKNAIINAAKEGINIRKATLYTLYSPCFDCTKTIINSEITRVVSREGYDDSFAREMQISATKKQLVEFVTIASFLDVRYDSIIVMGWIGIGKSTLVNRICSEIRNVVVFPEAGGVLRKECIERYNEEWNSCSEEFEYTLLERENKTYLQALSEINKGYLPVLEGGFIHDSVFCRIRSDVGDDYLYSKFYELGKRYIERRRMWDPAIRPYYIILHNIEEDVEEIENDYLEKVRRIAIEEKIMDNIVYVESKQEEAMLTLLKLIEEKFVKN